MNLAPVLSLAMPLIAPLVVPVTAIIAIALWSRREYPLRPRRLWITPLLLGALIAAGLYLAPHPPFDGTAYAAMLLSGASGLYFGIWQANETVLRHDPDTGRIMASNSNIAVAVLAAAVFVRFSARQMLGDHAALASDMSLLFALGLVVALRLALWRRARRVRSA